MDKSGSINSPVKDDNVIHHHAQTIRMKFLTAELYMTVQRCRRLIERQTQPTFRLLNFHGSQ